MKSSIIVLLVLALCGIAGGEGTDNILHHPWELDNTTSTMQKAKGNTMSATTYEIMDATTTILSGPGQCTRIIKCPICGTEMVEEYECDSGWISYHDG